MKRIAWLSTIAALLTTFAVSLAAAQDSGLGDYARKVRKQKGQQAPAVKTFDNDNIPMTDKLSVVGQEPAQSSDANATNPATTDSTTAPAPASPTDQAQAGQATAPAEDEAARKKALYENWKKKIQDQQGQVDTLAREVDLLNREY